MLGACVASLCRIDATAAPAAAATLPRTTSSAAIPSAATSAGSPCAQSPHQGPSPAQSPPPRAGSPRATAARRGAPHSRWGPRRRHSRRCRGWNVSGRCRRARALCRRRSRPRPPLAGWALAASTPSAAGWAPRCRWTSGVGGNQGRVRGSAAVVAWMDATSQLWACLRVGLSERWASACGSSSSSKAATVCSQERHTRRAPATWCRRHGPCARSSLRAAARSGHCRSTWQRLPGCQCCALSRPAARRRRRERGAPAAASAHRPPLGCTHSAAHAAGGAAAHTAGGAAGHRAQRLCRVGALCARQGPFRRAAWLR